MRKPRPARRRPRRTRRSRRGPEIPPRPGRDRSAGPPLVTCSHLRPRRGRRRDGTHSSASLTPAPNAPSLAILRDPSSHLPPPACTRRQRPLIFLAAKISRGAAKAPGLSPGGSAPLPFGRPPQAAEGANPGAAEGPTFAPYPSATCARQELRAGLHLRLRGTTRARTSSAPSSLSPSTPAQ